MFFSVLTRLSRKTSQIPSSPAKCPERSGPKTFKLAGEDGQILEYRTCFLMTAANARDH